MVRKPTVVLVVCELFHKVRECHIFQELLKSLTIGLCLDLSFLNGHCNELDSDLGSWTSHLCSQSGITACSSKPCSHRRMTGTMLQLVQEGRSL